jgi:hypothetical protein
MNIKCPICKGERFLAMGTPTFSRDNNNKPKNYLIEGKCKHCGSRIKLSIPIVWSDLKEKND